MKSRIAALWGTTVGYQELPESIFIEKNDGRVMVISHDTFDYLYYRLDDFTAALKEDCIEYAFCDESYSCVTLKNHLGDIKHMDVDTFTKYYDDGGN